MIRRALSQVWSLVAHIRYVVMIECVFTCKTYMAIRSLVLLYRSIGMISVPIIVDISARALYVSAWLIESICRASICIYIHTLSVCSSRHIDIHGALGVAYPYFSLAPRTTYLLRLAQPLLADCYIFCSLWEIFSALSYGARSVCC